MELGVEDHYLARFHMLSRVRPISAWLPFQYMHDYFKNKLIIYYFRVTCLFACINRMQKNSHRPCKYVSDVQFVFSHLKCTHFIQTLHLFYSTGINEIPSIPVRHFINNPVETERSYKKPETTISISTGPRQRCNGTGGKPLYRMTSFVTMSNRNNKVHRRISEAFLYEILSNHYTNSRQFFNSASNRLPDL